MFSIDSAGSSEVTPSLAQTRTKQPQILSCKGDSEQHQLPRKPADVVACVHQFDRLMPKFRAASLSLFSIEFSTRYALPGIKSLS
jgi:hypothetical protein